MVRTCLVGALVVVILTGCSQLVPKLDEVLPDRRTEYKKSKSLPDLEVPPDLTTDAIQDRMAIPNSGEAASFSTFQERAAERKRDEDLERSESSAIKLLENETVLAVEGVTVQIWPRLRSFWNGLGYELELDDEELGVIETTWNENQEELVRDKFKVFAEPGEEAGTTLLYVSHRGEELVPQGDNLIWQARARDVALERRIVERIQQDLGGGGGGGGAGSDATVDTGSGGLPAAPVPAGAQPGAVGETYEPEAEAEAEASYSSGPQLAELVSAGGGKVYLAIGQEFAEAWDSTGAALSRAGIEVEQEDRGRGVYMIRVPQSAEAKKEGVFSKLKFWGGGAEQLQLTLTGVGPKTELVVLNREGQWETGDIAGQLLGRINQELNAGS